MESTLIPKEFRAEFAPSTRDSLFIHQPTQLIVEAKPGAPPVLINPMDLLPIVRKDVEPTYTPELWPLIYRSFRRDSSSNTITVAAHTTLLRLFNAIPLLVCASCGEYTCDPRDESISNTAVTSVCKHKNLRSCLGIRVNSTRPLFVNLRESIIEEDESNSRTEQSTAAQSRESSLTQSAQSSQMVHPGYQRATKPPERPLNVRHRPSAKPTPPHFIRIGTHMILHQPTRLLIHTRTKLEIFNPYASQRTLVPVFPGLRQWASLTEWAMVYTQLQDAGDVNFLKISPNREFASVLSVSEIALCSKCRKKCFKWTVGCDLYNDNTHFKTHVETCGSGPFDYLIVEGFQTQNVGEPKFLLIEKDGVKTVYDDSDALKFPSTFEERKVNGLTTLHFTEYGLRMLQEKERESGLEVTKESAIIFSQDSGEASIWDTKLKLMESDDSFTKIAPEIFFHKPSRLALRTMVLQKLVTIINPEISGTFQRMRKEVDKQHRPFLKRVPPPWSTKYRQLTDPKVSNVVFFTPDGTLTELLKFEKLLLCSSCRKFAYQNKPSAKKDLIKHQHASPTCQAAHWISCKGVPTTQMSKAFFIIAGSESE